MTTPLDPAFDPNAWFAPTDAPASLRGFGPAVEARAAARAFLLNHDEADFKRFCAQARALFNPAFKGTRKERLALGRAFTQTRGLCSLALAEDNRLSPKATQQITRMGALALVASAKLRARNDLFFLFQIRWGLQDEQWRGAGWVAHSRASLAIWNEAWSVASPSSRSALAQHALRAHLGRSREGVESWALVDLWRRWMAPDNLPGTPGAEKARALLKLADRAIASMKEKTEDRSYYFQGLQSRFPRSFLNFLTHRNRPAPNGSNFAACPAEDLNGALLAVLSHKTEVSAFERPSRSIGDAFTALIVEPDLFEVMRDGLLPVIERWAALPLAPEESRAHDHPSVFLSWAVRQAVALDQPRTVAALLGSDPATRRERMIVREKAGRSISHAIAAVQSEAMLNLLLQDFSDMDWAADNGLPLLALCDNPRSFFLLARAGASLDKPLLHDEPLALAIALGDNPELLDIAGAFGVDLDAPSPSTHRVFQPENYYADYARSPWKPLPEMLCAMFESRGGSRLPQENEGLAHAIVLLERARLSAATGMVNLDRLEIEWFGHPLRIERPLPATADGAIAPAASALATPRADSFSDPGSWAEEAPSLLNLPMEALADAFFEPVEPHEAVIVPAAETPAAPIAPASRSALRGRRI